MKLFTLAITWLYLTALLIVWGMLQVGSEYRWPVTILLLGPRWLLAVPLLILLPAALVACRTWLPLFAAHVAILLFPIMGLRFTGLPGTVVDDDRPALCLLTCNVGGGTPRVEELVDLVGSSGADIVFLQECEWSLADAIFQRLGWQFQHRSGLALGSHCGLSPAATIASHGPQRYNQAAALACTVELDCLSAAAPVDGIEPARSTESRRLRIVSIHLPTLRPALAAMLEDPIGGGSNLSEVVDEHARVSADASRHVKQWDDPFIVAGDFNMPVDSNLFSEHWGQLQNAYSLTGNGFGHTKFTRLHGVRIDHVLTDASLQPVSAEVAKSIGGDHRPVIVRLSMAQGKRSR